MRYHLENIAKVREADIEISGISVVAGDNATGKSTISRGLMALFSLSTNMSELIQYERAASVAMFVKENAKVVDSELEVWNMPRPYALGAWRILMNDDSIATTNFEKVCVGVQMTDLYCFVRKVMEKNNWNISFGKLIVDEYNKVNPLSKDQMNILYVLLLYPEKFWKITNFYYNARKSWVPRRNIQKLQSLSEQSKDKNIFLENLKQGL